jgi:hypothetical protein
MYYSYVEIEYVATSFSPARTDLALELLRKTRYKSVKKQKIVSFRFIRILETYSESPCSNLNAFSDQIFREKQESGGNCGICQIQPPCGGSKKNATQFFLWGVGKRDGKRVTMTTRQMTGDGPRRRSAIGENGSETMVGSFRTTIQTMHNPNNAMSVQRTLLANFYNDWVMVGYSNDVCLTYMNVHNESPTWGLTGEKSKEITQAVICCCDMSASVELETNFVMSETTNGGKGGGKMAT